MNEQSNTDREDAKADSLVLQVTFFELVPLSVLYLGLTKILPSTPWILFGQSINDGDLIALYFFAVLLLFKSAKWRRHRHAT